VSFRHLRPACFLLLSILLLPNHAHAQAAEGTLSEAEVESLRDAAYVPMDRITAYEKILDTRQKRINELMASRRHAGRELDLHDLMDQFAAITDELTDNLDDYRRKNRDVRKVLPKLLQNIDRWSTSLHAPPDDPTYNIVRKLALDNLKDLRDEAEAMVPEQEAYFKAHPDAAKAEHDRMDPERTHAPKQ
jgi:predicted secreted Zn-dependent protease